MPKSLIVSTARVKSGVQTIEQFFAAKQREIEQLKAPKIEQTEERRLEDLLSCLHIIKECLLQVIGFVIENAEENDLISWRVFPNHEEINLGDLPPQQLPPLPPPPPPLPSALIVKPQSRLATQIAALGLKYTLDKLLSVLSNIYNLKKLDVFKVLLQELDTINREERGIYEQIMKEKYKELPQTLTKHEELIQIANRAKAAIKIIQNNMDKILVYNIAAVEVFFISIKDKLPGITEGDWREISSIIINDIMRPRTLLEEYNLLAVELKKVPEKLGADSQYITQRKDLKRRYDSLTRRLKFLVRMLPWQQGINITDLSIAEIMSWYEQDKDKSIIERRLDAQQLVDVMQAINPYKVITPENLVVIEQGELEKKPTMKGQGCMEDFLDSIIIRSPFRFISADVTVEPLASLQRKLTAIPGAKISAATIFQDLQNPKLKLFSPDSEIPQNSLIEQTKDEKLQDYITPLEEMINALKLSITELFGQIDICQAKLKIATDAQEQTKITAAIQLQAKLTEKQHVLQSRYDYLIQRRQELISNIRFSSYRHFVVLREAEHSYQRHDKYIAMLTQLIMARSSQPKIAVPVIALAEARRKKEANLRDDFFVGMTEREAKARRDLLEKFEHITEDEYTTLLHSAVKLEGTERRIKIVAWIRKKLEEKAIDLDACDIDEDIKLQREIFQQVIVALSMGIMTTSELETFFLGMDATTKLVVFAGNEGDENRTLQLRTLPIQKSRAFFLAMVEAQARNAWLFAHMGQFHNLPEQIIAKNFTSEEINKILRLPAFHSISNFNPLNEEQSAAIVQLLKDLVVGGVGQYLSQEPDLRKSYFLLRLENIIGRKIISSDPPYMFIFPENFKSAYQVATAPVPVVPTPAVIIQEAPTEVAANVQGRCKGLVTPVKKQLVKDVREGLALLKGKAIDFDDAPLEHEIATMESLLEGDSPDIQGVLRQRQDIIKQIEETREKIIRKDIEARQQAEERARRAVEARQQAEESARRETEIRQQAEENARREAEARQLAEESARRETEARQQAEESARREAEARQQAEAARIREEIRRQQQLQAESAQAQAALVAAQQQILAQQQAAATVVEIKPIIINAAITNNIALLSQYLRTRQDAMRFLQENRVSLGTIGFNNFSTFVRTLR